MSNYDHPNWMGNVPVEIPCTCHDEEEPCLVPGHGNVQIKGGPPVVPYRRTRYHDLELREGMIGGADGEEAGESPEGTGRPPSGDDRHELYMADILNRLLIHIKERLVEEKPRKTVSPGAITIRRLAKWTGITYIMLYRWLRKNNPDVAKGAEGMNWNKIDSIMLALNLNLYDLLGPCELAAAYLQLNPTNRSIFRAYILKHAGEKQQESFERMLEKIAS